MDAPDDHQGPEYSRLRREIQKIVRKHKFDAIRVVLWVDWACISQEDSILQAIGISSLIAYAARADFMFILVASDLTSACAIQEGEPSDATAQL